MAGLRRDVDILKRFCSGRARYVVVAKSRERDLPYVVRSVHWHLARRCEVKHRVERSGASTAWPAGGVRALSIINFPNGMVAHDTDNIPARLMYERHLHPIVDSDV